MYIFFGLGHIPPAPSSQDGGLSGRQFNYTGAFLCKKQS